MLIYCVYTNWRSSRIIFYYYCIALKTQVEIKKMSHPFSIAMSPVPGQLRKRSSSSLGSMDDTESTGCEAKTSETNACEVCKKEVFRCDVLTRIYGDNVSIYYITLLRLNYLFSSRRNSYVTHLLPSLLCVVVVYILVSLTVPM